MKKPKGSREIVVDGQTYFWKLGAGRAVIRTPDGRGYYPLLTDVTGLDWNTIERASWKGYLGIKPAAIENAIRRLVLGQDVGLPDYYDVTGRYGR